MLWYCWLGDTEDSRPVAIIKHSVLGGRAQPGVTENWAYGTRHVPHCSLLNQPATCLVLTYAQLKHDSNYCRNPSTVKRCPAWIKRNLIEVDNKPHRCNWLHYMYVHPTLFVSLSLTIHTFLSCHTVVTIVQQPVHNGQQNPWSMFSFTHWNSTAWQAYLTSIILSLGYSSGASSPKR